MTTVTIPHFEQSKSPRVGLGNAGAEGSHHDGQTSEHRQ